jgi:hypothetical protein
MQIINKILFIFLYFLTINYSYSLTFKSNGEIISSKGEVLTKPYSERYQEALTQYINGEEILDWPTVELNNFGNPIKRKGYMGEKILEEGAPLFALPNLRNSAGDPVEAISLHNGLVQENFIQVLLATSSEKWSKEKGFDEEIIKNAKLNAENLTNDGFQEFKISVLTKDFIKDSSNYSTFNELKETNSFTELSAKLNKFYGVDSNISSEIIEQKYKLEINTKNFAINAKSFKEIIEEKTGIKINDHGWTDDLVRDELNSLSKEIGTNLDIDEELKKINEEAGQAALDYANSDLKQTLEEAANAARDEAVNDVAARVAAAEAYVESARAAREEAERAVSEAATEEATEAALSELERTLLEEQGANDNLNNVIEAEATEP